MLSVICHTRTQVQPAPNFVFSGGLRPPLDCFKEITSNRHDHVALNCLSRENTREPLNPLKGDLFTFNSKQKKSFRIGHRSVAQNCLSCENTRGPLNPLKGDLFTFNSKQKKSFRIGHQPVALICPSRANRYHFE